MYAEFSIHFRFGKHYIRSNAARFLHMRMSSTSRKKAEPSESPPHNTSEEEETSEDDGEVSKPHTDLSSMSFEELIQLQNKVGTKAFHRAKQEPPKMKRELQESSQLRKTEPLEMSSKKPVSFLRKVVSSKNTMRRDPRFDDLSGEYKPEVFTNTYKFLDEIKKKEREVVQKKLQKTRDPQMQEKLQRLIQKMDQQEDAALRKQKLKQRELEYKKQLREGARQGKKPFYLKKGDMRKVELADKYQELRRKGKLEHFLSKKRKRNSHKDRRRLPNQ